MPNLSTRVATIAALLLSAAVALAQTAPATSTAPATGRGRGGRGGGGAPPLGTLPPGAPARDTAGTDAYWGDFAAGTLPRAVGTRLALNYVSHAPLRAWGAPGGVFNTGWYAEICMAFGSLRIAQDTANKPLADDVVKRFAPILTPEGKNIIPPADHVDRSIFGVAPLEIYRYTKDPAWLAVGKPSADAQWGKPPEPWTVAQEEQTTGRAAMGQGLSYQTRFWIDDMYMLTSLQVEAYRATGDKTYLDHAAKEMAAYLDKLQQPNGLFHHAEGVPYFWGRGNGWVAAGMTELISELPKEHPQYARCLEGYTKMMAALLKFQNPDGSWNQLIDKPTSWKESSCTGMFTFAFAMGVRNGLLPEAQYKPAAKKAWIALCTNFIDDNANVKEVCAGTNKFDANNAGGGRGQAAPAVPAGMDPGEFYYDRRPRNIGDPHGQAGALWAAWAMTRAPVTK